MKGTTSSFHFFKLRLLHRMMSGVRPYWLPWPTKTASRIANKDYTTYGLIRLKGGSKSERGTFGGYYYNPLKCEVLDFLLGFLSESLFGGSLRSDAFRAFQFASPANGFCVFFLRQVVPLNPKP